MSRRRIRIAKASGLFRMMWPHMKTLPTACSPLQRFDEARQMVQQAQARNLDDFILHSGLYALAFLRTDSPAMAKQQQWFAGRSEENSGLSLASDSEAYTGHLVKARELTKGAIDSAIRADSKETGAIWQENAALREAAFGNAAEARQAAAEALKLVPTSQGVEAEATLAFAVAHDVSRSESLAQDLNKASPWIPRCRRFGSPPFGRNWHWIGGICQTS
jgi:eukaryotic-like serine/threonine-protein kinase